jgi:hypothetical protein
MTEHRQPPPQVLRALMREPSTGPAQADPHEKDREEPGLTVVVPEDPPLLTPLAADALLKLIRHVAGRHGIEIQADERRGA